LDSGRIGRSEYDQPLPPTSKRPRRLGALPLGFAYDQLPLEHPTEVKRWPEALLLACSIGLCLLAAEIVLRVHYSQSSSGTLEDLAREPELPRSRKRVFLGEMLTISASPRRVYQMVPGLDVRFRGVPVRTNSDGWRDREVPPIKGNRTLRIVGIGDSVMFGWGVPESQRYMDQLEQRLNREHSEARWRTITLAAPGYNLVMEVETLKEVGLAYSPDLIVVGYSVNDFCLPNFVAARRSVWGLESFIKLYFSGDATPGPRLVQRLDAVLDPAASPEGREGVDFFSTYCTPDSVAEEHRELVGAESFMRSLTDLVQIGRDRGIPIVLLHHGIGQGYVSLGEPTEATPEEMTRALAEAASLDGLIVADLTLRFRRRFGSEVEDGEDLVLNATDPHPSSRGHQLIAAFLLQHLERTETIENLKGAIRQPEPE